MADNPNVGPEPVDAEPNRKREKTYEPADTPVPLKEEMRKLPENTAEDKVRDGMGKAVDEVRKKL